MSLGFLAFIQFQHPWLPETDGYYHIKAAFLMRTQGLFRDGFKWAALSLWRDSFSDTCLLFHAYLMPFTLLGDLALAAKCATALMSAACFTSFYWIIKRNGARAPAFWLFLLMSGGHFFLWRISVPRPQILSVTLMLWCVHFLVIGRRRALGSLSFLYALSYSAAFFPFVFACIRSVHLYIADHEKDWKTPAAAFGGFAAGMIANPYFPRDLRMLYVQNFYALKMSLGRGVNLSMGGEFFPLDTRVLLGAHLPIIATLLAIAYFGHVGAQRKPGSKTAQMLPIAAATILMTLVWKRFTEYSVPLTLLYCALRATELLDASGEARYFERHPRRRVAGLGLAAVFYLGCAIASTRAIRHEFRGTTESQLKGAALYLKEHAAPDETVFTCDWDEAPELFFYNHSQRYLVFMDPVFMYYWNPDVWQHWSTTANGRLSGVETASTIKEISGARYGVCKERFLSLRDLVSKDAKMRMVYDDGHAFVFKL